MDRGMNDPLNQAALEQVFLCARTTRKFIDRQVDDAMLRRLYDLYKWGPTALNCQAGRILFLRDKSAKVRLKPFLMPGNVAHTMAAPVTAVLCYDTQFHEHMPAQFPANPGARDMFSANAALAQETAFRNSTLQGAYFMLAVRMLGLDAGPMSGFDGNGVNQEFFPDGRWRANFLVNLGWGDRDGAYPRGPRLDFDEVIRVL